MIGCAFLAAGAERGEGAAADRGPPRRPFRRGSHRGGGPLWLLHLVSRPARRVSWCSTPTTGSAGRGDAFTQGIEGHHCSRPSRGRYSGCREPHLPRLGGPPAGRAHRLQRWRRPLQMPDRPHGPVPRRGHGLGGVGPPLAVRHRAGTMWAETFYQGKAPGRTSRLVERVAHPRPGPGETPTLIVSGERDGTVPRRPPSSTRTSSGAACRRSPWSFPAKATSSANLPTSGPRSAPSSPGWSTTCSASRGRSSERELRGSYRRAPPPSPEGPKSHRPPRNTPPAARPGTGPGAAAARARPRTSRSR